MSQIRPDITRLYQFYQKPLGQAVAEILSQRIAKHWPTVAAGRVAAFGYAPPFLAGFEQKAQASISLMPAGQGACHWPAPACSKVAMVPEYHWPLADSSVDKCLLVHALEHAGKPDKLLREAWRILVPGGQLLIIVPNRRRWWSALDSTPFGYGHPFSQPQLCALMAEQLLPASSWETALLMPPLHLSLAAKAMTKIEGPLARITNTFGGVLIVAAEKRMYGGLPVTERKQRSIPALVSGHHS